jgi:hypothetical protein
VWKAEQPPEEPHRSISTPNHRHGRRRGRTGTPTKPRSMLPNFALLKNVAGAGGIVTAGNRNQRLE